MNDLPNSLPNDIELTYVWPITINITLDKSYFLEYIKKFNLDDMQSVTIQDLAISRFNEVLCDFVSLYCENPESFSENYQFNITWDTCTSTDINKESDSQLYNIIMLALSSKYLDMYYDTTHKLLRKICNIF